VAALLTTDKGKNDEKLHKMERFYPKYLYNNKIVLIFASP